MIYSGGSLDFFLPPPQNKSHKLNSRCSLFLFWVNKFSNFSLVRSVHWGGSKFLPKNLNIFVKNNVHLRTRKYWSQNKLIQCSQSFHAWEVGIHQEESHNNSLTCINLDLLIALTHCLLAGWAWVILLS